MGKRFGRGLDRLLLGGFLFVISACAFDPYDRCTTARAGDELACAMPGELDRAFTLLAPPVWDGASPLPLLVAFHGGGGNRRAAESVTCPGGDPEHPGCLTQVARARGYAVVLPDGSGTRPLRNIRTWNAGGGAGGWQCTSGPACEAGVDDVKYFDALLAEVGRAVPVDPDRVYLTGLSNGGAMSHRLACERFATVAAIAAVGGANQFAAAGGTCSGGVHVLQIHGTEDPCWQYETGTLTCANLAEGRKVGVAETMAGWGARNGCSQPLPEEPLPDVISDDGTRVTRITYAACTEADVELLRVDGGGHTWPSGDSYLDADTIGRVSRDIDSGVIVDFFDDHRRRRSAL